MLPLMVSQVHGASGGNLVALTSVKHLPYELEHTECENMT